MRSFATTQWMVWDSHILEHNFGFLITSIDKKLTDIVADNKSLESRKGAVVKQMIKQISTCVKRHPKCASQTANFLPKRLIDVGTTGAQLSRLYETQSSDEFPYVALSYCWGGDQENITTTANYEGYTQQLPEQSLARSIREAINLTRGFQFRYL